jgi:hypothetical protein
MPYRYDPVRPSLYGATIGDMILRRGDIAAQEANQVAAVKSRGVQNIGAGIANGLQDVATYKAQAPIREMQQIQLENAREGQADHAAAHGQQTQAQHDEMAAQIGHEILLNGGTPDAVHNAMQRAVKGGALSPDEAQQFTLMSVENADKIPDAAKALMSRSANGQALLERMNAPKPAEKPLDHNPEHDLVMPDGRVVIAGKPKTVEPKAETRSLDVQAADALAKGDTETYTRLLKVKKEMGQADDRPRITVNTGGGASSLSDDGVEYAATQYRLTGKMPALGNGNGDIKAKIISETARQAKAIGQSPAASIQKQAAYKADGAALTKMQTMSSAAESFENKALGQADIVSELSGKVGRTGSPMLNGWLLAGKDHVVGDSDTHQLFNAISTFSAEYAKIMEGSTGSAAGSSDSARKATARLVSASQGKKSLEDTLNLMRREMRLTIGGYDATISHITERMGGNPAAAAPAVPARPQLAAGVTHVVEQNGVRYEVTTDASGKVVSSKVVPK